MSTGSKLFHGALTERSIASGMVNRYLILPGSAEFEPYTGRSYRVSGLEGKLARLKAYPWGLGQEIKDKYADEAWQAFVAFQNEFILPLQRSPDTSEALSRLHLHLQHVAALYAWQEQSPWIELRHFQAAQAIITVSKRFVEQLLEERAATVIPTKVQAAAAAMEQQVIARLKRTPGMTAREAARVLTTGRNAGYTAWMKTIEDLIRTGGLLVKEKETRGRKRQELHVAPGL